MDEINFIKRLLTAVGVDVTSPLLGRESWIAYTTMILFTLLGYFAPKESTLSVLSIFAGATLLSSLLLSLLSAFVFPVREEPAEQRAPTLGGFWMTQEAAALTRQGHSVPQVLERLDAIAGRVWPPISRGLARTAATGSLAVFCFGLGGLLALLGANGGGQPKLPLAVANWNKAAEEARSQNVLTSGRPLPATTITARAQFEEAWRDASWDDKQVVEPQALFDAFANAIRSYRAQEADSRSMTSSTHWADAAINHFEQSQDSRLLSESLLEKAAIFLARSQLKHTDPESFRDLAQEGDELMTRVVSQAKAGQKSEALRIWSRFYYNLARPQAGNLADDWSSTYLMLAHDKAVKAQRIDANDIKNLTQLSRVVHRIGSMPSHVADPAWTQKMRQTVNSLRSRWDEVEPDLINPQSRIPPLNILAVLTAETVWREWQENDGSNNRKIIMQHVDELDTALDAQREVYALVKNTEWGEVYAFDVAYDLGRIHLIKHQLLRSTNPAAAEVEFSLVLQHMAEAAAGAKKAQLEGAMRDLENRPELARLDPARKEQVRNQFGH